MTNKKFIVTFGFGQTDRIGRDLKKFYTVIHAINKTEAKDRAVELFGDTWSNIHTSEAAAGVHRFHLTYLAEVNV